MNRHKQHCHPQRSPALTTKWRHPDHPQQNLLGYWRRLRFRSSERDSCTRRHAAVRAWTHRMADRALPHDASKKCVVNAILLANAHQLTLTVQHPPVHPSVHPPVQRPPVHQLHMDQPVHLLHMDQPVHLLHMDQATQITKILITSSNLIQGGIVDGGGASWWGYANYVLHGEDRPKLFTIQNGTDIVVERWHLRQSPYHTFHFDDVRSLVVRFCSVDNRHTIHLVVEPP